MRYAIEPKIKSSCEILNEEDVAVRNVKIDLTHGRHNPLERLRAILVI